ncbi:hypothetical protein SAMN05428977_104316 [Nitrosomonas sp. Nm166]|nr:hypothetical protein SAMN05428977_104316 [Nitrosomonas sp. Nm166]
MNRSIIAHGRPRVRVPHARGDEPRDTTNRLNGNLVFPTPVGMNRWWRDLRIFFRRVPHARGDEPRGLGI